MFSHTGACVPCDLRSVLGVKKEQSAADPGFWSGGTAEFSLQGGPEPKICSK